VELQASIGPIPVAAGQETTVCITESLGNGEAVVVNSLDVSLAPGSHHLVVYATNDPVNLTPTPCTPFAGTFEGTAEPLVFSSKQEASWTFPAGLGQDIASGQRVRVEAHYINSTAAELQGSGIVKIHAVPKSSAPPYEPVDFTFWGTTKISIPPYSTYSTGPIFQAGLPGTHLISVTTHEHRLGTRAQIWGSKTPGDTSNPLADDQDWANPSYRFITPWFDFDGTNGLTYQCDWDNSTSETVSFGESALDEMCVVGGYYFPSHGLDLCIDGYCPNRVDGGAPTEDASAIPAPDDAGLPDGCGIDLGLGALDASIGGSGESASQCLACGVNKCPTDWAKCEADCSCVTFLVNLFDCFQDAGTISSCAGGLFSADGITQGFSGCMYGNCVDECLGDGG
jgi:hypothetical protein